MQTITLSTAFASTGAKNLNVSQIVLGVAGFGGNDKIAANHAILDAFVAAGGSFVDTARVYGRWIDATQTSYSEEIFGKWLEQGENRASVRISTKGAHPAVGTWKKRVTPEDIRSDVAESLQALRTDELDVYFLHRDDTDLPVSVIMDELNRHAAAGELNLLGASNWTAARIYEANDYCVCHGMRGFDVSQICVNVLRLTPEQIGDRTLVSLTAEEEELYLQLKMPVMAFSSLAMGFPARYFADPEKEKSSRFATPENLRKLERIRTVCADTGLSLTEVSVGYLCSQKVTILPIVGTSRAEHIRECIAASDTRLSEEQIAYIDGK